ncbi:MAG: asparagine--tRNA ligase [Candidatus Anstonellales archaeon]
MMSIKDLLKDAKEGKKVSVRGWVYRHRILGEDKIFIVVRDGSGIIQGVVKKDGVEEKVWRNAENLYIESSILVKGEMKKDERAPGGYEIKISEIEVVHQGLPFPIQKDLSEEFLLDVRHLWLRSRKMNAIMKGRHFLVEYLREWLNGHGFYEVAPPIITKSGSEGGADMFEIDYFGSKAYLTQSSQLYAEAMMFGLERVYVLAPSFRAEKSRTRKHLAEYWHLEPEMAWVEQKENMEIQEQMVSYAVQKFVKENADILEILGRDEKELKKVKPPFPRLDYEKAVEKVNGLGGKMRYGDDFGADEEAILTEEYDVPIFVHNFPKKIKPFYMPEDPKKPGTVLCDDMLAPKGHGEIIGGSERIWKLDELEARMKEVKLDPKDYEWYVDLRRYGSIPHSGFGLGIERFVKWVLNLENIRDAIPFPRTITRVYP